MKIGNNSINVLKSMATRDNYRSALLKHYGWFDLEVLNIVKVSDEIATSEPYYPSIAQWRK